MIAPGEQSLLDTCPSSPLSNSTRYLSHSILFFFIMTFHVFQSALAHQKQVDQPFNLAFSRDFKSLFKLLIVNKTVSRFSAVLMSLIFSLAPVVSGKANTLGDIMGDYNKTIDELGNKYDEQLRAVIEIAEHIGLEVCNEREDAVWVAYGYKYYGGAMINGYKKISANECKKLLYEGADKYYIHAINSNGTGLPISNSDFLLLCKPLGGLTRCKDGSNAGRVPFYKLIYSSNKVTFR